MANVTESAHLSHRDLKRPKIKKQNPNSTDDDSPTHISNLMPDIMVEILSRLSLRSLLQLNCVCKYWHSLISDTHLSNHRLIFSSSKPRMNFKYCSIYSLFNEASVNALNLNYLPKGTYCYDRMIGSCNGLVCIRSETHIVYLWNPTTYGWRRLKESDLIERFLRVRRGYVVYGFGYDYSTSDYKVLVIICNWYKGNYETEVEVYSQRKNSWKMIQGFPYGAPRDEYAKYVSGALHWQVYSDLQLNSSWKIVALDLANETYREVLQPVYQSNERGTLLGVLGGNLCLLCYYATSQHVWVMNKYGVGESWKRLFTIPYFSGLGVDRLLYHYNPLYYTKNGEVLLKCGSRLVLYNSKNDTFRFPAILNFDHFSQVAVYVKSLVHPHPSIKFV